MEPRRIASANRSAISATRLEGISNGHGNTNNRCGGHFRLDGRRFPGDLNLAFRTHGSASRGREEGRQAPCTWRVSSEFRGLPGKDVSFPGADPPSLDPARNSAPGHPAVHSAALLGAASMERYMRISRSRRICLSCGRSLPRAAARCPWCITSVVVPAALADHSPAAPSHRIMRCYEPQFAVSTPLRGEHRLRPHCRSSAWTRSPRRLRVRDGRPSWRLRRLDQSQPFLRRQPGDEAQPMMTVTNRLEQQDILLGMHAKGGLEMSHQ